MKTIKDNKKLILIIIFIMLIGNISTVFAYSLFASNISFTSKDTSWEVTNTKEALDELYVKANLNLLDKVYPVGSIYLSIEDRNPSRFIGGEWEQVAQGRTLFGEGTLNDITYTANTEIDAGLPNIQGQLNDMLSQESYGAFNKVYGGWRAANGGSGMVNGTLYFDASRSNSIYGSSATVQPNAYVVYMYKRIK